MRNRLDAMTSADGLGGVGGSAAFPAAAAREANSQNHGLKADSTEVVRTLRLGVCQLSARRGEKSPPGARVVLDCCPGRRVGEVGRGMVFEPVTTRHSAFTPCP
jgi:hypothetical protein